MFIARNDPFEDERRMKQRRFREALDRDAAERQQRANAPATEMQEIPVPPMDPPRQTGLNRKLRMTPKLQKRLQSSSQDEPITRQSLPDVSPFKSAPQDLRPMMPIKHAFGSPPHGPGPPPPEGGGGYGGGAAAAAAAARLEHLSAAAERDRAELRELRAEVRRLGWELRRQEEREAAGGGAAAAAAQQALELATLARAAADGAARAVAGLDRRSLAAAQAVEAAMGQLGALQAAQTQVVDAVAADEAARGARDRRLAAVAADVAALRGAHEALARAQEERFAPAAAAAPQLAAGLEEARALARRAGEEAAAARDAIAAAAAATEARLATLVEQAARRQQAQSAELSDVLSAEITSRRQKDGLLARRQQEQAALERRLLAAAREEAAAQVAAVREEAGAAAAALRRATGDLARGQERARRRLEETLAGELQSAFKALRLDLETTKHGIVKTSQSTNGELVELKGQLEILKAEISPLSDKFLELKGTTSKLEDTVNNNYTKLSKSLATQMEEINHRMATATKLLEESLQAHYEKVLCECKEDSAAQGAAAAAALAAAEARGAEGRRAQRAALEAALAAAVAGLEQGLREAREAQARGQEACAKAGEAAAEQLAAQAAAAAEEARAAGRRVDGLRELLRQTERSLTARIEQLKLSTENEITSVQEALGERLARGAEWQAARLAQEAGALRALLRERANRGRADHRQTMEQIEYGIDHHRRLLEETETRISSLTDLQFKDFDQKLAKIEIESTVGDVLGSMVCAVEELANVEQLSLRISGVDDSVSNLMNEVGTFENRLAEARAGADAAAAEVRRRLKALSKSFSAQMEAARAAAHDRAATLQGMFTEGLEGARAAREALEQKVNDGLHSVGASRLALEEKVSKELEAAEAAWATLEEKVRGGGGGGGDLRNGSGIQPAKEGAGTDPAAAAAVAGVATAAGEERGGRREGWGGQVGSESNYEQAEGGARPDGNGAGEAAGGEEGKLQGQGSGSSSFSANDDAQEDKNGIGGATANSGKEIGFLQMEQGRGSHDAAEDSIGDARSSCSAREDKDKIMEGGVKEDDNGLSEGQQSEKSDESSSSSDQQEKNSTNIMEAQDQTKKVALNYSEQSKKGKEEKEDKVKKRDVIRETVEVVLDEVVQQVLFENG